MKLKNLSKCSNLDLPIFFQGTCCGGTVTHRSSSMESCCNARWASRVALKSHIQEESERSATWRVPVKLMISFSIGITDILFLQGY